MIELFVFVYGIIIGSFLNVLIYRLPLEISLLDPKRSFCPSCYHQIKWYENIPLLSYLFLQGKCSQCDTKISIVYPIIEFLSGILSLSVYLKFGFGLEFILFNLLFFSFLVLSAIDFKHKAVPDYILLFTLIIGFFIPHFNFLYAFSFAGGFILLDFFVTFYIQNIKSRLTNNPKLKNQTALGSGDIPIIAILGGVLGLKMGLIAIFLSALFALLPALYATILKKELETPYIPYLVLGFWVCFFFEIELLQLATRLGL